jgi:N-acetylglucosaminyl-diphospho-decaprenol L-rhamnosyltransferase
MSKIQKIRFVTVCFKNATIVNRLLQSIDRHCKVPFEVICWDNSPLPLADLGAIKGTHAAFYLAGGKGNIGFTKAVNHAVNEKGSDDTWTDLVLINPDAYFESSFDAEILSRLSALNGICGLKVFSNIEKTVRQDSARSFPGLLTAISGREGLLTRLFPNNALSLKYLRRDLDSTHEAIRVDWVSGCALYASRKIWADVKGFDERYFLYVDDVDLGKKAAALEIPVFYTPWVEVVHESRSMAGKDPWKSDFYHHSGMMKYYWKWSSPFEKLFFPITIFSIWFRFTFRLLIGKLGRTST